MEDEEFEDSEEEEWNQVWVLKLTISLSNDLREFKCNIMSSDQGLQYNATVVSLINIFTIIKAC